MSEIIKSVCVHSVAVFSECDNFRYRLSRVWDSHKQIGVFLCENPSKADHLRSDNTISNCMTLAVNWSWGGFELVNLYPGFATNRKCRPTTPESERRNMQIVKEVLHAAPIIILACGQGHKKKIKKLIEGIPNDILFCIAINSDGSFLHPSRISVEKHPTPQPAYTQ